MAFDYETAVKNRFKDYLSKQTENLTITLMYDPLYGLSQLDTNLFLNKVFNKYDPNYMYIDLVYIPIDNLEDRILTVNDIFIIKSTDQIESQIKTYLVAYDKLCKQSPTIDFLFTLAFMKLNNQ